MFYNHHPKLGCVSGVCTTSATKRLLQFPLSSHHFLHPVSKSVSNIEAGKTALALLQWASLSWRFQNHWGNVGVTGELQELHNQGLKHSEYSQGRENILHASKVGNAQGSPSLCPHTDGILEHFPVWGKVGWWRRKAKGLSPNYFYKESLISVREGGEERKTKQNFTFKNIHNKSFDNNIDFHFSNPQAIVWCALLPSLTCKRSSYSPQWSCSWGPGQTFGRSGPSSPQCLGERLNHRCILLSTTHPLSSQVPQYLVLGQVKKQYNSKKHNCYKMLQTKKCGIRGFGDGHPKLIETLR